MNKLFAAVSALLVGLAAYSFVPPPRSASADGLFNGQASWGGTSTGSANAQAFTIPNLSVNTVGIQLRFIPGFTNTGPTQVNVSGIGLVTVLRPSSIGLVAFSGQEFTAGEPTTIEYNGSSYVLARNIDVTPIGKVVQFRGSSPPRGTLIEDGSCVSQTTYAALFAVIGTTYNSQAPVACTTGNFALPDSRGSYFAALDTQGANGPANRITSAGSGCVASVLASRCGSQNYTQLRSDMPNTSVAVASTSTSNFPNGSLVGGFASASGSDFAFNSNVTSVVSSNGSFQLNGGVTQTAMPRITPVLFGLSAIKY